KLGQLVEEQDPVMGERDLSGTRLAAAADEAGGADRVVRSAKRPLADQAITGEAEGRVYPRGLERLGPRQSRQDRRQAPGEHGLAYPWWADEKKAMAAGDGDLEGGACRALAAHVGHVGPTAGRTPSPSLGARQLALAGG